MSAVVGWDIGGVHLKAVRAEGGRIVKALQIAAPLRGGTEQLVEAFALARREMGRADRNVITMTGELADTFASRADGTAQLAGLAARELSGVLIYAGPRGYVRAEEAQGHCKEVASANWHAAATVIARRLGDALFIDLGSTTTDIVPIVGGKVAARGYTDSERLAAGELVYTGLVRGFAMATARRAPLRGVWTPLINENFATMADVHRILGTLPAGVDLMATADGREKTVEASRARLARMVGCDASDADDATWLRLAQWFAEAQMHTITEAAMLVMSACAMTVGAVVAAGIGADVVAELARRLRRDYVSFHELLDVAPEASLGVSQCAPAAALAWLGSEIDP